MTSQSHGMWADENYDIGLMYTTGKKPEKWLVHVFSKFSLGSSSLELEEWVHFISETEEFQDR